LEARVINSLPAMQYEIKNGLKSKCDVDEMHNAVKQKAGLVLVEALKERLDKLTEQVSRGGGGKGRAEGDDSGSEYEDGSDEEGKSQNSAIQEDDDEDSDRGSPPPKKKKKDIRV
jgi:hypothetical protein